MKQPVDSVDVLEENKLKSNYNNSIIVELTGLNEPCAVKMTQRH